MKNAENASECTQILRYAPDDNKEEIMKNKLPRLQIFDVLKAIAILAVVYTHCLQFMGIGAYWHHPIFKLTYAFHMPLFMVISGYFAYHSLQLPLKELIKKKSIQLLFPV